MMFRRWILLVFGVIGGMLAATALYISAESSMAISTVNTEIPTFSITEMPKNGITLPAAIPGTALIAQRISAYDGPFLEDKSDREVVGIAALLVYNGGSREIALAQVTLQYGDNTYGFIGENIPAAGLVVLLEQDAKPYRSDEPDNCIGWQIVSDTDSRSCDLIAVTDVGMGSFLVTNLSERLLNNVCIYYKSWLSPPDIYVGGISYCVTIPQLLPGQKMHIDPEHYAVGYSKVVSVTAE